MKNNAPEDNDKNKKNAFFKIGKLDLSRSTFLTIVVVYSSIVLILKDKFNSKIAEFLYQISFFAAIIIIIFFIYRRLKASISNRKP